MEKHQISFCKDIAHSQADESLCLCDILFENELLVHSEVYACLSFSYMFASVDDGKNMMLNRARCE